MYGNDLFWSELLPSGLHSYAAGDPIPVPAWVYISIGIMTALGLGAYYKYKKLSSSK